MLIALVGRPALDGIVFLFKICQYIRVWIRAVMYHNPSCTTHHVPPIMYHPSCTTHHVPQTIMYHKEDTFFIAIGSATWVKQEEQASAQ